MPSHNTVLSLLCVTFAKLTTTTTSALIATTTTTMNTTTISNVKSPSSPLNSSQSISMLTWNVLARDYTKYNKELPGCVQGHHNPEGRLETVEQTRARHKLAVTAIIERAPDAVLLQELSADFFDTEFNPFAAILQDHFVLVKATNDAGPGTGVLLRKSGPLRPAGLTLSVGGSEETGGTSKSASGVLVRLDDQPERPIWLISIHLTPYKYSPEKVCVHLAQLGDALRSYANHSTGATRMAPPRMVIGGDLNAEPSEVRKIQRACPTLGGALYHVDASGPTGLSSDFSSAEYIDHLFLSPGLRTTGPVVLEREPGSPYGIPAQASVPSPVIGASDHVWQSVDIELV